MLRGRSAEWARLAHLVDDARRGRSATLVLRGEPGAGKSALLDALAEAAEGVGVLRVSGAEAESELAFAGIHGLLRPLLGRLDALPPPRAAALRAALAMEPT